MTKRIGILTALFISLLALPAAAADQLPDDAFEIALCRIEPATISRFVTASLPSPLWSRLPHEEQTRPAPPPPRIQIEANDTLAALNFSNSGSISPYIGAGIGHEEPPIHDPSLPQPLSLRLGAGFGCDLDTLTRLFFNYSFHFSPDSQLSEVNPRLDETHQLSLGLQFTF